ncbi:MAG: response regulator [Sulfurimonas sp.]|nr:response regulator [Sulfurimonas sp.]
MQNFLSTYYTKITGAVAAMGFSISSALQKYKSQQPTSKAPEKSKEHMGAEKLEKQEVMQPLKPDAVQAARRNKREYVAHGKISKEDFEIFKGVKILVAEDNIINQKVIFGLLSTSGIEVTMANNGQEALDILEKNRKFSMIFMDAHMPVMNGFEATIAIRKNPNYENIPVIALSGDIAADDIRSMFNAGMEAHLEKPLKMDALYDILYIYSTGNEAQNTLSNENEDGDLEELKEFNTHKGLEICGGDKEFYIEILHDFILRYSNSAKTIQEYISASGSANASRMLLDISGVAANIGADELQQVAIDFRNSLSNPEDMEYINYLRKYKRLLQEVCEAINKYTSRN